MATKPVGQAEFERMLMAVAPAQGALLGDVVAPVIVRTGKPGRPKGRRNNKTLMRLAQLDNMGAAMLRGRIDTAMLDPVDEARRTVAKIYHLPLDADPSTVIEEKLDSDGRTRRVVTFADLIATFTIEFAKLREKAREGVSPFVLKKKPTEVDITEKKITEARFIIEDRRQLPGGMQTMVEVVDGTAEVVDVAPKP